MGIVFDVGVAIAAFQNAMNAGTKFLRIDAHTMTCRVLQALVGMTGQTIRFRAEMARSHGKQQPDEAHRQHRGTNKGAGSTKWSEVGIGQYQANPG
jgi:hypothetical protein